MAAYIRKVRTGSGATAVQIAEKIAGRHRIIDHLGSAHTEAELAALVQAARDKLDADQLAFDLPEVTPPDRVPAGSSTAVGGSVITGKRSRWLIDVIEAAWSRLGFDQIDDEAFFQLVLARIVEPTSKADSVRVLRELGVDAAHRNTFTAALRRCVGREYRDQIAYRCFDYAAETGGLSLVLYDVTTLYFEAEKEDQLRKVGYSKERRVDPQIVVGLLVDRNGFPLEVGCFEGNHAETRTIIPIVKQFAARHGIEGTELVIAADAGMLSAANLTALDEAGLKFIVGSKVTKAPKDLASHFRWHGNHFTDGQIIDTVTPVHGNTQVNDVLKRAEPVWDPRDSSSWRAVWQYSRKRSLRDTRTLDAQVERAQAIVEGRQSARSARFVTTKGAARQVDEALVQRARDLIGLKGYVTNLPANIMSGTEVIEHYHALWRVEQSFRMSKTDLAARPIYHRQRDSIEAHLTIVFAALAVSRYLQDHTGTSIRSIVQALRPLQEITLTIGGHPHTATDPLTPKAADIVTKIGLSAAGH